jgi:hypothetical protein
MKPKVRFLAAKPAEIFGDDFGQFTRSSNCFDLNQDR